MRHSLLNAALCAVAAGVLSATGFAQATDQNTIPGSNNSENASGLNGAAQIGPTGLNPNRATSSNVGNLQNLNGVVPDNPGFDPLGYVRLRVERTGSGPARRVRFYRRSTTAVWRPQVDPRDPQHITFPYLARAVNSDNTTLYALAESPYNRP